MKVTEKNIEPGIVVLEMSGRFMMGRDCLQLDRDMEARIARGERNFIFDLSGVDHVDSAAVGQIVKSFSTLKRSGGMLRLAGAAGMVDRALTLTQVNKAIEVYPTVQEAAKSFSAAT
jgi:anti-sigma B factor antagonist